MTEELLPCPFCGGKAILVPMPGSFEGYGVKIAQCESCKLGAYPELWNKRNVAQ